MSPKQFILFKLLRRRYSAVITLINLTIILFIIVCLRAKTSDVSNLNRVITERIKTHLFVTFPTTTPLFTVHLYTAIGLYVVTAYIMTDLMKN